VFSSGQEFEAARQELLKRYNAAAKGPSKAAVVGAHMDKLTSGVVKGLFENMALVKKNAEVVERKLAEVEAASAKQRDATLRIEKDLEYLRKEKESATQELKKRADELQQERDRGSQSTRDVTDLRQRLTAGETEGNALKKEVQKLTAELQALRQRAEGLERDLKATKDQSDTLNSQLRSTHEKSSREVTSKDEQIAALSREAAHLKEAGAKSEQLRTLAEKRVEELSRATTEQSRAAQQTLEAQMKQAQRHHEEQVAQVATRAEGERQQLSLQNQQLEADKLQLQVGFFFFFLFFLETFP